MAVSQNGYIANRESLTRIYVIPRCGRHIRLRRGTPGFLLVHFATWFDRKIEPLDQGVWDEWGYAERDIRGSETVSNHASGTAEDLNATEHPMGVRGTFTPRQRRRINRRLKLYRGCIRAGMNYENRPDDMHFEIDRGLNACDRVWRVMRHTPIGQAVRRANFG